MSRLPRQLSTKTGEAHVARELGETSLMYLVHPTISIDQMAGYAEAVRSVVLRACR